MKEFLAQLSKILLKINHVTKHKLSTTKELKECQESMQILQQDMKKLHDFLDRADQSLPNDDDVIVKLIVDMNREFGNMVQEMQDIRAQLKLVAQRYVKLKNITDD